MLWFTIGIIFLMLAPGLLLFARSAVKADQNFGRNSRGLTMKPAYVAATAAIIVGSLNILTSSTMFVGPDEGGIVAKKFGASLQGGHIIAVNGERGTQADVVSPGWSFGWWPFMYSKETVKNLTIEQGKMGIVTALDGKPLPDGEVYAPAWDSTNDMLDARKFLEGQGCKGPQLTVLPPGTYRFNPKLFTVQPQAIVDIKFGECAAVRSNVGKEYIPAEASVINGVPLVPKGSRGIWSEPLLPGQYYLHPQAYEIVMGKTTKRVYSYTGGPGGADSARNEKNPQDNSIRIRSQDGFNFPVDVRVSVYIEAKDMPYIVAKFGPPDIDPTKDGFDELENKAILPSIRAILRNSSENQKAMEFVNSRSKVEADALAKFREEMTKDRIQVEAVYLADIRLDSTDEGKKLLETQTNKEIALQEQQMYQEQVRAATEKGKEIQASTEAEQKKGIQESMAKIEISKNEATAAQNKAEGDAAAYEKKRQALTGEGVENLVRLEMAKIFAEQIAQAWKGELPKVLIVGGSNPEKQTMTAWMGETLATESAIPAILQSRTPGGVSK